MNRSCLIEFAIRDRHWLVSGLMQPMALLLLFASCHLTEQESPAEKLDPYDQFALQRSWPDKTFDAKGWHRAMNQARIDAMPVSDRNTGCGGGGNPTNWTLQGPSNVGGRANTLAVKPDNDLVVLAGFAAGGIFKSIDGGVSWYPVFDDNPDLAIGCLKFDPVNPNVLYAGTGDPNIPSNAFNGNGVYKSTDAGETWQHLGLDQAGIISKILINPQNTQILYAAAMGNPAARDANRGVYKSTDGGASWQQILFVSDQAGASDLVVSPSDPQILYAAFWDRIRNNFESIIYGPHAGIYKTIDGGGSWTHLAGGLPQGIMGRIGLAISQQDPGKLYAVYVDTLSKVGGLYKTADAGGTWTAQNITGIQDAFNNFGWYFAKLRLNPANDEDLYLLGVLLWRKPSAAASWSPAAGGHADSHDFVATASGRRYWASDGGVYRSAPGQSAFTKCVNLPTTQVYHTDFNPHFPGTYFIGAQDNGFQKGSGAAPNSWATLFFADGFNAAFDPVDSNTFWIEIQNGTIYKTTTGGDSWGQPQAAFGTTDRCNWNAPFFMSPHTAPKRYAGTYRVYESSGDSWTAISGDLTNYLTDTYHTVSALDESPVLAGKLIAGTSDGNIWRREPTGPWVKLSAGLTTRYVSSVHGSPTSSDRLYVTYSGFSSATYIAHVLRSDDNGQTWTDISANLPPLPVNDLYVVPNTSDNAICAATDAGVYLSLNGGQNWTRLGNNMPFVPVFALDRNPVQNQLVAGTFARGLWTFPMDSLVNQPTQVSVSLSGMIHTETASGVSNVQLSSQPTVLSVGTGQYTIPGISGCQAYTITPYRNDFALNGLSTYDLVLISKHILGISALDSPYKLIAADANKNGSVTTFDIVELRKLILGIDTVFAHNTSWRFVPTDFVFPNPAYPFQTAFPENRSGQVQSTAISGLDFVGIKIGDVNGSAMPFGNDPVQERTAGEWPLWYQDQYFQSGDRVEVLLTTDCSSLAGLQYTLQFDPQKLSLEQVEPVMKGLSSANFGLNRTTRGLITVCFEVDPIHPVAGQADLFKIVFNAKTSGRLSDVLDIADHPTPALAYESDGLARKPVLYALHAPGETARVWPNPFGATGVWLQFPTSGSDSYQLTLFDQQGRVMLQQSVEPATAAQGIHIPAGDFPAQGVYDYRFGRIGERPWVGKVVCLK